MDDLVIMKDKQAVTSSLQVAETFGKQHKDVLEAINTKISTAENSALLENMFLEGQYTASNGKANPMYYMNRDGFAFIVMGFTGHKADGFKLQYIKAFNEMEQQIKLDVSQLSPGLQMVNGLLQEMAQQELATKQLDSKVDGIAEIVGTSTMDWRNETTHLINKIAHLLGGGIEQYKEVRNEIYAEVDRRAGVSLKTRLTNLRNRMASEGTSKSQRDKMTKVDVIGNDKKLIEIYLAVVKEFAIKYKTWNQEY